VAFGLSLSSSNASAAAITALWDQASAFEDQPSMRALDYPPHITFAVYDAADVTEELATAVVHRVAEGRTAIEIGFDRVRHFPGSPMVLWADPDHKQTLFEMHRRIHACIDPVLCRPHYRPGNWTPHCTLATRTVPERNAEALVFADGFRGGVRVIFDRVDCVQYPPVTIVAEVALPLHPSRTKR
jgi:2'-5' RNA ligase